MLDFEPLSADVAPQMTLFGPAPEPRRPGAVARARAGATSRRSAAAATAGAGA